MLFYMQRIELTPWEGFLQAETVMVRLQPKKGLVRKNQFSSGGCTPYEISYLT